jgi:hypothetical protein
MRANPLPAARSRAVRPGGPPPAAMHGAGPIVAWQSLLSCPKVGLSLLGVRLVTWTVPAVVN